MLTTDTDLIRENNQEGLQVGDFKVGDRVRVRDSGYALPLGGRIQEIKDGEALVMLFNDGRQLWYPITLLEPPAAIVTPAPDVVSHPPHYTDGTPPGIEAIDIIRAHMKAGGTWETANALKYILRHPLKDNPTQDIAKASQYLSMWTEEQASS